MPVLAPRIMRGFTLVADDDVNLALSIEELALPTLEETIETFQPGGLDGEIDIAGMGTKALVIGCKVKGHTPQMLNLFSGEPGTRHNWTGKQLVIDEETGDEFEHAIDVKARLTKITPGAAQGGKPTGYDYEMRSVFGYTEYWNGAVLHAWSVRAGGWTVRNSTPVNTHRTSFLYS